MINLGGEVGSVCSEGPWLFVGMPNVVKVSLKPSNVVIFPFFFPDFVSSTLIWRVGDAAGVEYRIRC